MAGESRPFPIGEGLVRFPLQFGAGRKWAFLVKSCEMPPAARKSISQTGNEEGRKCLSFLHLRPSFPARATGLEPATTGSTERPKFNSQVVSLLRFVAARPMSATVCGVTCFRRFLGLSPLGWVEKEISCEFTNPVFTPLRTPLWPVCITNQMSSREFFGTKARLGSTAGWLRFRWAGLEPNAD